MEIKETTRCQIVDLGVVPYSDGLAIQKEYVKKVIQGEPDALLLCEHPPVLTLGRLATEDNFLKSVLEIQDLGIGIERIDRGGEVTLHAPGQLVSYPVFNLSQYGRDLKVFLHKLEQVAIDFLQDFDIMAHRFSGQRGVWVGPKKIASIGIGVKRWVSYHGMAINLVTDLELFSVIRPCGLDVKMTSVKELTGASINMPYAKDRLIKSFSRNFNLDPIIANS